MSSLVLFENLKQVVYSNENVTRMLLLLTLVYQIVPSSEVDWPGTKRSKHAKETLENGCYCIQLNVNVYLKFDIDNHQ